MTTNRKKYQGLRFPKMEEAMPFDPDEFNTALNWYQNTYMNEAKIDKPSKFGVNLDYGNGKVDHIRFTDIPMNRGMIALKERYGHDTNKFFSISMRIFAFIHIMHEERLKKYTIAGEDFVKIHPAVTDAAALVMLDEHGNFPVDAFIEKVEELIKTKYDGNETCDD